MAKPYHYPHGEGPLMTPVAWIVVAVIVILPAVLLLLVGLLDG